MENYNLEHYMQMQLVEISEHRWYMGERLNRPINDFEVMQDWIYSGHAKRFQEAYMSHLDDIENACKNGLESILKPKVIHRLLED